MSSNQQIEEQLVISLRRIDAPYRQALSILDEASAGDRKTPLPTAEHLQLSKRLRPSMEIIAACEEQLAPLREQWRNANVQPGHELQQLLSNQADLLKRLIERLNEAETDMANSQSELGLKLDGSRTHVAMRQAYQSESA